MAQQVRIFTGKRGTIKVRKIVEYEYEAMSESKDGVWYRILFVLRRWFYGCKRFAHTNRACKHIAAMKRLYAPVPPAMPKPRARRREGRKKMVIDMPAITCRFCGPVGLRNARVRHNKLRDMQACRCPGRRCNKRFTPDDGLLGKTYRDGYIVPAPGDRASCKKPHGAPDPIGKSGHRTARSTLHTWYVHYPRMTAPYLMSLDFFMSETMYVDEIVTSIGGRKGVIYATEDDTTRLSAAHQTGRFKGSHDVGPMFQMDLDVRGTVPSLAGSGGAENFSSAHKRVLGNNGEGKPSMHTRRIHLDGDINTNLKERDNDMLEDFVKSCKGLKSPGTAYIGLYQTHFNVAITHMGIESLRHMEAVGVYYEHPNKWLAPHTKRGRLQQRRRAWGHKAGQGDFATPVGISGKAAVAPTSRVLNRSKTARSTNFRQNREKGAGRGGAGQGSNGGKNRGRQRRAGACILG